MPHSIHDKSLDAKKTRILINALIDCARAGVRSSFSIKQMICGISLYLECGKFNRENWRTYHRVSDAARLIRDAADKDWKRHLTFEHTRPIDVIYRMMLAERQTLTLERAAIIIGEYPPVLVTIEEELRMTKLGFKHGGELKRAMPKFRFQASARNRTWRRRSHPPPFARRDRRSSGRPCLSSASHRRKSGRARSALP
jgi:hypothetical protein